MYTSFYRDLNDAHFIEDHSEIEKAELPRQEREIEATGIGAKEFIIFKQHKNHTEESIAIILI